MVETHSVLDSSHVRVPNGPNQRQCGFPMTRQERPKWVKLAKRVISKAMAVLMHFFQGYRKELKCFRQLMSGYLMEHLRYNGEPANFGHFGRS